MVKGLSLLALLEIGNGFELENMGKEQSQTADFDSFGGKQDVEAVGGNHGGCQTCTASAVALAAFQRNNSPLVRILEDVSRGRGIWYTR